jgi:ATP-binding cassette subfamily C exporter for protease/lipase
MRPPRQQWQGLMTLLAGLRKELLLVGALSMAINLLMLAPSLYMLQVYDRVMISRNELTLLFSTLMLVLVLTLVGWFEQLRTGLLVGIGIAFDKTLQATVFHDSIQRELRASTANPVQTLLDLAQVRQFVTSQGIFAFFDAPWFFIYAGVLTLLHPLLGAMGLAFAMIHLAFLLHGRKVAAPLIEGANQSQIKVSALQQSQLRNAEALQAMGMLPDLQQRWKKLYDDWALAHFKAETDSHHRSAFSKFLRYTQQSLSLGAGAVLVIQGEISAGSMIVTNILMTRMLQPLDAVSGSWRAWLGMQSAMQRIHSEPTTSSELMPEPASMVPADTPLSIRASALKATAEVSGQFILNDIELSMEPGSVVGLVGHSGAGKTSLGLALLGLMPHTQGAVYWNDQPVSYCRTPGWQSIVGYLPPQVEFVTGTVAHNIARFGENNPEEVVKAATLAGVHDMILRLPKGYDTPIGPQGIMLSSGQKQRIGLARALYGQPRWVVLDEPDAHLDDVAEESIRNALFELKSSGCTMLLITHKKRILSVCDRILLMESGRITRELSPLA